VSRGARTRGERRALQRGVGCRVDRAQARRLSEGPSRRRLIAGAGWPPAGRRHHNVSRLERLHLLRRQRAVLAV